MDSPILIVAAIILVSGVLGGIGAFLAEFRSRSAHDGDIALWRSIVLGIIAAACVPLFLSLVRSEVIGAIFGATARPQGGPPVPAYEAYLIFVGLCLLAAFSSRRFIDSVSRQLFQRLNEVATTASQAKQVAADAKDSADQATDQAAAAKNVAQRVDEIAGEAADEPDAPPPEATDAEAAAHDDSPEDDKAGRSLAITSEEERILQALKKRTYRTRTGIAEDSGVGRNRISEMLESMAQRKLALPTRSPTTGGQRWIITKRGDAALKARP